MSVASKLPFEESFYQIHNIARLQHLDSLGLDLRNKKVIDLGAGIGDHTIFYLYKNCDVLSVEGRTDLVERIKDRLKTDKVVQIDFEKELYKLKSLDKFDYIHCYGLLYHLSNPGEFIEAISQIGTTLLLETCVSPDESDDHINLVKENKEDKTQAISGVGCRPNRRWIYEKLQEKFKYVYLPITQPKHPEFPLIWDDDFSPNTKTDLIRAVFIASNIELDSPLLTTNLPTRYKTFE